MRLIKAKLFLPLIKLAVAVHTGDRNYFARLVIGRKEIAFIHITIKIELVPARGMPNVI